MGAERGKEKDGGKRYKQSEKYVLREKQKWGSGGVC